MSPSRAGKTVIKPAIMWTRPHSRKHPMAIALLMAEQRERGEENAKRRRGGREIEKSKDVFLLPSSEDEGGSWSLPPSHGVLGLCHRSFSFGGQSECGNGWRYRRCDGGCRRAAGSRRPRVLFIVILVAGSGVLFELLPNVHQSWQHRQGTMVLGGARGVTATIAALSLARTSLFCK